MPLPRLTRYGAAVVALGLLAGCSQDTLNTVSDKLFQVDRTIHDTLAGRRSATSRDTRTSGSPHTLAAFFAPHADIPLRTQSPVTTGPQQQEYQRGVDLALGQGGTRDQAAAVRHLKVAAEAGHPDAEFLLGLAYWGGDGVAKNDATAVRWFRKAAAQGHAEAQYLLGIAYLRGRGVDANAKTSTQWFRKAAEAGHTGAQYQLGVAYATGHGVARDDKTSLKWLTAAAESGNADAQELVASAYTNGRGTAPDHAWAAMWYGLAAEQGVARAQYMLGISFAGGLGLPKQPEASAFWLSLAAKSGSDDAKKVLPGAEKKLDDAQRKAVARRVEGWKPTERFGAESAPIVRYVQVALTRLGYRPGVVDGQWGPNTRSALTSYRRGHDLATADRITADDLFRLRRALNGA